MVEYNPEDRASINEIKESKWYNGPVYESHELKNVMTHLMKKSHWEKKLDPFFLKDNIVIKSVHS